MPSTALTPPGAAAASRRALAGFIVSGLILAFPGAILPAWGYHLRPHYVTVGNYFLAIVAGVLLSVAFARLQGRWRTRDFLLPGSLVAFASFVFLSFTAPPAPEWLRLPGLAGLGLGAGLLNRGIFRAISHAYRTNAAATVNLAGIFFGMGSFLSPLLIAGTFNLYSPSAIFYLAALAPGAFAIVAARLRVTPEPEETEGGMREVLHELSVPGAVLLALLLFFHFGNEWVIAGWLPLFLIVRLGMSPVGALVLLAAYWLALMLGRVATQAVLPRVSHTRLLMGSVVASLFGFLLLTLATNQFGAWLGTLVVGFGFAPIYPLVVEKIGARFPRYHPGFYNGIFSVALTGGMLAPALAGYAAESAGSQVVMLIPAAGTFIVLLLVLGIWVEAKLTEWTTSKANDQGV